MIPDFFSAGRNAARAAKILKDMEEECLVKTMEQERALYKEMAETAHRARRNDFRREAATRIMAGMAANPESTWGDEAVAEMARNAVYAAGVLLTALEQEERETKR